LFPQSRIISITHQSKGKLADRLLRIESRDIEAGWHGLFSDSGTIPPDAVKLVGGAHTIVSFLSQPDDRWTRNVGAHAPEATVVSIDPNPPPNFTAHVSEHLLKQLMPHQVVRTALQQMLRSVADRGIGLARQPGSEIVIHPGSGSREKCWPAARFVELIERLKSSGRKTRVVIGEVERERMSRTDLSALAAVAQVHQPVDYLALAEQFTSAALVVANDSGPAHLAGIMGVPTLALFGPTDPVIWKPLGPKVHVLEAESLDQLNVESVLKSIHNINE
jgi:heptosyltransferase III